MSLRKSVFALLAFSCSCGSDPPELPPYALSIEGPPGPFRGLVEITAMPEPADGTVSVSFSVDGEERARDTKPPYVLSLDLSHDWGGAHQITAIAARDDGARAEASLDVTYDPLGPFVTVKSPDTNARVPPSGGTIDVALIAGDPSGLGAAAVQLDQGEPMLLPIPSLSLTVPVPAATALPATPVLSWWIDDLVGNRTQGTLQLLQSHERFGASFPLPPRIAPLSGERLALLFEGQIRALEADGGVAWILSDPAVAFEHVVPAAGGDILVVGTSSKGESVVRRIHADGSLAWEWSGTGGINQRVEHVGTSDSLLVVRRLSFGSIVVATLLGPTGQQTFEKWYAGTINGWPLATRKGAAPAAFAVATTKDGSGTAHYDIFDPAGTLAWSCDIAGNFASTRLLTRDVLYGLMGAPGDWQSKVMTSGGTTTVLGEVDLATVAPNGDLVIATHSATGSAVTRVHPDASAAWQVPLPSPATQLSCGGDRVIVSDGSSVRVIDATGAAVVWSESADSPLAALSPSGAFYVISVPTSFKKAVYRVAADGTTQWQETLVMGGEPFFESVGPSDERLAVSGLTPQGGWRVHVFEP